MNSKSKINRQYGAILLLAVVLLLSGCRSTRQATTDSHIASHEIHDVRAEVSHIARRDTLTHPYSYQLIRHYHIPTGRLEREEIRGRGELTTATTHTATTETTSDHSETSETSSTSETSETLTTSQNTPLKAFIWGFAIGVVLTITAIIFIRLRRV